MAGRWLVWKDMEAMTMGMKMKRSGHILCNHVTLPVCPFSAFHLDHLLLSSSSLTSSSSTTTVKYHHQFINRYINNIIEIDLEGAHVYLDPPIPGSEARDDASPQPCSTTTTSKTGRSGNQTSMVRIDSTARLYEHRIVLLGYGTGIVGDKGDGTARRTFWRWGWAAENRGRSGQVSFC